MLRNAAKSRWQAYPTTYRAREIGTLASWLSNGTSGTLVALPGMGRATLLGYLWHRPEVFASYMPDDAQRVTFIPIDLNILPDHHTATFYRVILRSFYQVRQQFETHLAEAIALHYRANLAVQDAFLPQSALFELLDLFAQDGVRVVWILNFFDLFCRHAQPPLIRTLRSLRDHYKGTLHYLIGMQQEIQYLVDLVDISPLYHILDRNVMWMGALSQEDTLAMLAREFRYSADVPDEAAQEHLWQLTGGIPSLIRVAAHWYRTRGTALPTAEWREALLNEASMQERLTQIWHAITEAEKLVLAQGVTRRRNRPIIPTDVHPQYRAALRSLEMKGLVVSNGSHWEIVSDLFAYFSRHAKQGRGRVWYDETANEFYQGQSPIPDLRGLERSLLNALVENPQVKLMHSELIEAAWPEEVWKEGVTTDALYQHVSRLRRKIEPLPTQPAYIVKWRGQPEGGYQFFPDGKPAA